MSEGDVVVHEYNFGSTTETLITVISKMRRLKQRDAVRVLERNTPPVFTCAERGDFVEYICTECINEIEKPFYCDKCDEEHSKTHDSMLHITNSPRMGECGYDGEEDTWTINPKKVKIENADK